MSPLQMASVDSAENPSSEKDYISISSQLADENIIPANFTYCSSNDNESLEPFYVDEKAERCSSMGKNTRTDSNILPSHQPNRLWIKKDVDYNLDLSYEDRIWDRFVFHVNMLKENKKYEGDMKEDAFYFSYKTIPVNSIEVFQGSEELVKRMSCERLREMSLQLIEYSADLNRETETFIGIDNEDQLEEELGVMVGDSILRKKRILSLVNKVRNYMGEIILMGERCHGYILESEIIAFKDISSMNKRFKEEDKESDFL